MVVLASSLASHGREPRDEAMNQQAWAKSVRTKMAQARQCSLELEKVVAKIGVRVQQTAEDLQKVKDD